MFAKPDNYVVVCCRWKPVGYAVRLYLPACSSPSHQAVSFHPALALWSRLLPAAVVEGGVLSAREAARTLGVTFSGRKSSLSSLPSRTLLGLLAAALVPFSFSLAGRLMEGSWNWGRSRDFLSTLGGFCFSV